MSSSSFAGGVGGGESRDYGDYFVLSAAPAQRRLWFLCQLDPASNAAYNVVSAVRLTGELDVVMLQRALNEVVARHESLRTGIGLVDGDPHQLVVPETLVSLAVVDCTHLSADAALASVRRLAADQAALPFTFDAPPLVRVALVRESRHAHTLVVVIHHMVCDGWSMDVFYRDLATTYQALREGRPSDLPELPVQYADYVAWQEQNLTEQRMDELVAHWRDTVTGTAPLRLPVDRPRDRRGGAGGRVEIELDAQLVGELNGLADRAGATPFMVLLAAFKVALARITGQDDIAVGTPVAGRHHPDAEQLVGYFANTLVLRTGLAPEQPFSAAVAAVRDTCLSAFSHDRMPFDRLVQELRQTRVLDRNPLFDVMFSMQNTPGVSLTLPDLTMSAVELGPTAAKFDLWLTVLPDGDRLRLRLDHDLGLYDERTAARVLDLHRAVLVHALRDPDAPIGALPAAGPADRTAAERWAVGPAGTPADRTVLELLAARRADDVVLSAADAVLTLPELRQWAADLAARLRADGIAGPGVVVTTPPVPSAALVAVLLAVFDVGAVLAYGRKHDRAGAFVRHAEDEPGGWLITTGPRFDPVASAPAADLNGPAWRVPHRGGEHAAVLSHRSLTATLTAVADRLSITPDDDVLLLAGTGAPHPVDLLLPLVRARSLLLVSQDAGPSGPPAAFVLADAPTWRKALTSGWQPPQGTRLVCRDEVVAPDLADALARTGHPVFLWRTAPPYGLPVDLAPLDRSLGRHLGPPLAGTTRRLLDIAGDPVPIGLVGDLHVAGTGHPAEPTGLRCRHTGNGELELIGPARGRLVVGDHVVALAAVERELAALDGVRAAVAAGAGDGELVAWVVPEETVRSDRERDAVAARVRARAQAVLPPHEVPALVAVVDEIPTASDGTIDHAALPAPPRLAARAVETDVRPRTATERRVLAIFRDVVPVREFGMHADFFSLGGHSLLAAKLISRVRAEFGVLVPIRDFFRDPSPAGLAGAIERLERERDGRATGRRGLSQDLLAGMSDDEVDQLLRQLN
ncbi:condensation domain-containing protein [Umezawaea beigongshangensis]|uniref:condensation domain-containing protein n=1 Tax=Umezawaea beigongshangensis TaxID=2780383 RepID=UPI0018F20DC5|nr:condensation domain-containing protein [Umezawaea beigongshangensis]